MRALVLVVNFSFACLQVGGDVDWWRSPVALPCDTTAAPFSEATWSLVGLSPARALAPPLSGASARLPAASAATKLARVPAWWFW